MPAGKGGKGEERRGSSSAKRETFRPPWVKDDPDGLPPKPSNLWSKTRQPSRDGPDVPEGSKKTVAVKTNEPQENGTNKEHIFVKPQLKPVPPKEATQTKLQSREVKVPIKLNSVKKVKSIDEHVEKPPEKEKNPIIRQESLKKVGNIPKAPPIPPPAPKLPKPGDLKSLSSKQKEQIENLKNRPKVRPDWTSLLKEVESGKKLKHVQCNDRSQPLLPKAKDTDKKQFIYDSEKKEKNTAHNMLLTEIQQGVALKKTKTNDRSKPLLEGLRKFRRQMTIEEQIIKSQSMASIPPEEIPELVDELDDIDKVRDDLQSTKQMLAMELRNKEALTRENKRIATRLAQIEAELEKERANKKTTTTGPPVETDEKLVKTLKTEAADARKTAEDLEKKYQDASCQLDNTKTELEEVRKQKQLLEKKLLDSIQGPAIGMRLSISDRKDSINRSESEKEESESDADGSDEELKKERQAQREIKQLKNKLRSNKNKEDNAKKERMALKTQIKRMQQAIKDEKKKYRALKKEVNKMAALMKDVSDEDEDEEKEEAAEEEEEEEPATESESESESSETESESEKSVSEAEDAPFDKKKANVVKRTKKHEGRLSALKKGNYILKTNVERLQDDLNKQKDLTIDLQQDLDSVLSELG